MHRFTYLDPDALRRLANMQLRARYVVEGALHGLHQSPHRGASVEFSEHKQYTPGDELRRVDWRVLARADKYYVKQFVQETNLRAVLLLDCSGSMAYRGSRAALSKMEYGAYLAAALAHLLIGQGDAAGLMLFASEVLRVIPPRARPQHLSAILHALEQAAPIAGSVTRLQPAVERVAERARRRGLVFVISDLLDLAADPRAIVRGLRGRHHDVAIFHLLDPDEIDLPFDRLTRFEGLEGEPSLTTDPVAVLKGYLAELRQLTDRWRRAAAESAVDYQIVSTATAVDRTLASFLGARLGSSGAPGRPSRAAGLVLPA